MATLLICGAKVIDGTGRAPLEDHAVLVTDELIEAVGPSSSLAADGADVVDATGLTLLPGLINLHAHMHQGLQDPGGEDPEADMLVRAIRYARLALLSGVTTVRDVGTRGRISQTVRNAIIKGVIVGPRILSSGLGITTTGGHGWMNWIRADSAEELKRAARHLVEEQVNVFKVAATGGGGTPGSNVGAAQYSADELKVLVEEARRFGRRVAAHCNGTAGTRNAVEAGIDTIEHCGWMGPGGRLEVDEDVIGAMLEQGTTVVPTFAVWYRRAYVYVDPSTISEDVRYMRAVRADRTASWKAMHDAGVRFATGTDTLDPLSKEIELMVNEMGISPMEAIVAATHNSAEGLGLEYLIGTIEVGKEADLLLVEGDPLSDLGALRRVNRVFRAGKLVVDRGYLVSDEEAVDQSGHIPVRGGQIFYDQAFRPPR